MAVKNKEARKNVLSTANKEFAQEVASYGNEKLGHIWSFTRMDVIKVLHALSCLAEVRGKTLVPDDPDLLGNYLEWFEPEKSKHPSYGYRFVIWCL